MNSKSIAIVISLAKTHMHYCKALIASLAHFEIDCPVIVLKDFDEEINSIANRDNVQVVSTRQINTYHDFNLTGLLTKINICFLKDMGLDYDYYLHMDADSIVTSNGFKKRIEHIQHDFEILQGKLINYRDEKMAKLFNNYAFDPTTFENEDFDLENLWYFSSGHFVVSKTMIETLKSYLKIYRDELNTGFSKQTRFKFGDQGFFNFVVNVLSRKGQIKVAAPNSGIYGKETQAQHKLLNLKNVKLKADTNADFIHYTGPSRKAGLKAHNFGEVLYFFNKNFYDNPLSFYLSNNFRIVGYHYKRYKKRILNKLKHLSSK